MGWAETQEVGEMSMLGQMVGGSRDVTCKCGERGNPADADCQLRVASVRVRGGPVVECGNCGGAIIMGMFKNRHLDHEEWWTIKTRSLMS